MNAMNEHQVTTKRDARALLAVSGLMLLALGWFLGKNFFHQEKPASLYDEAASSETDALSRLRYAPPKAIIERQQAGDTLRFLDIRSSEAFHQEHIADAQFFGPEGWENFHSEPSTVYVIVAGVDTPSSALLTWDHALTQAAASHLFLEGGLESWKANGGMTLSFGDPTSPIDHSKVSYVAPEAVERLVQDIPDLLILDVRSNLAYRSAHLFKAVNFPLDDLEKRRTEIPTGRSILVYGQTELEGFQAAVRLFDLHFFGARILEGGFDRWQENKFYVETPQHQNN